MLTAVSAIDKTPSPLNLPGDLTLTTLPLTPAPAGIASTPPTLTGRATEPVKLSPALAVFDVRLVPMRITMWVPAGITMGAGGGGGSVAFAASGAGAAGCS